MIYKIYTFQYEANKFLYGLGKRHQQYNVSTLWDIRWTPVGRQYCEKQYFKPIEIFKYNQTFQTFFLQTKFFDPWPPLSPINE